MNLSLIQLLLLIHHIFAFGGGGMPGMGGGGGMPGMGGGGLSQPMMPTLNMPQRPTGNQHPMAGGFYGGNSNPMFKGN